MKAEYIIDWSFRVLHPTILLIGQISGQTHFCIVTHLEGTHILGITESLAHFMSHLSIINLYEIEEDLLREFLGAMCTATFYQDYNTNCRLLTIKLIIRHWC